VEDVWGDCRMRLYIQFARRNPLDWQLADSDTWTSLPSKAEPAPGTTPNLNNVNGWIAGLNCQGVDFSGADHYHARSDGTAAIVTVWYDSPTFNPPGQREAHVWRFDPLTPDPRIGGQLNTQQSRTIYAEADALARLGYAIGDYLEWDTPTLIRPWTAFLQPLASEVRHGVLMSDADWQAHLDRRTTHGWREWVA
jgi:hypothetical protein